MKKHFTLIIGLLLVGAFLRIWHIGANSLWFDEVFSRNVAVDSDAATIARDGVAGDVHPPLYFMLLSGWVRIAGDSDVALRFLSALLMILTLPAFYHLGRYAANERVGLLMLGLGVISPFQVYYAQESRQYALSVLTASWGLVGLFAALRGNRRGWWIYVAGMLGGLYTHYFTGLLLACINLGILVFGSWRQQLRSTGTINKRPQWQMWLLANVIIAILFMPQAVLFVRQTQSVFTSFWIDKPNLVAPLATLTFLLFSTTLPRVLEPVAILLIVCLLVISVVDMRRKAPRRVVSVWLLSLFTMMGTLLLILIISLGRTSLYLDKSFGLLSPLLLLTISLGVVYGTRPSPARLLSLLLAAVMIIGLANYLLQPDPRKLPFRDIARDLTAQSTSSVTILHMHDSSYLPILYYAPVLKSQSRLVNLQERSWLYPKTWEIFGVERMSRAELADYLARYQGHLLVVYAATIEPTEQATMLQLHQTACAEHVTVYTPAITVYDFELNTCPRTN